MMVQESLYATSELTLGEIRNNADKGNFNEIFLTSIDEYLSSIGESTKQEIYLHLREHHDISTQDISSKISEFAEALEESYGLYGKLMEIEIMKALYKKAGPFLYFPHGEDLSFADYIETLRCFV